jgi:hypothetical protein
VCCGPPVLLLRQNRQLWTSQYANTDHAFFTFLSHPSREHFFLDNTKKKPATTRAMYAKTDT